MPSGILLGEAFHIKLGRDPRIHSEHAAEITFVSWLRNTSVSLFRPLQPKYAPRSVTKMDGCTTSWLIHVICQNYTNEYVKSMESDKTHQLFKLQECLKDLDDFYFLFLN